MEWEKPSFYQGKGCQILLIALGVVMVIGFPFFNLLTYMDASRPDPTPYEATRWGSLIFGLVLFSVRIFLFGKAAAAKDGKAVWVVTCIIQGICAVLCIMSLIIFLWLSKGRYTRGTLNFFTEFKALLALLAITQGMAQRVFQNGHEIHRLLCHKQAEEAGPKGQGSQNPGWAIGQCIFKMIGCFLLWDVWRWFCWIIILRWWEALLEMSGF